MKKNDKKSLYSQKAIERAKRLFTEANQHLLYTVGDLAGHHYDQMQVPKVPAQLRRLALYGNQYKSAPKKKRSWNPKTDNEKKQLIGSEEKVSRQAELNPSRFKLCKLKEHHLASRKLKSISGQKRNFDAQMNCKVDLLGEEEQKPEPRDERLDYWEDMIHNREERHFQIGRIIKYLSD